jgi:putative transposase
MVKAGVSGADQQALTNTALRSWALGDEDFLENLEKNTQRRVRPGLKGRPFKTATEPIGTSI